MRKALLDALDKGEYPFINGKAYLSAADVDRDYPEVPEASKAAVPAKK